MKKTLLIISALISVHLCRAKTYNVADYGIKGDNTTINTAKINELIKTVSQNGGGTIYFPAGKYLSFTIKLQNNITIHLDNGAKLIGAVPTKTQGYEVDEKEPSYGIYQDFGHNHWRNSLIWAENVSNISLIGNGEINGHGINIKTPELELYKHGIGNQIIGIKLCKNVSIKDLTLTDGGHFALLATGADNITLDNLRVDTGRDGFDIDCCKNVKVSNCYINAPYDDGICLKSSFALGYSRATENITITNCQVTAYNIGALVSGTFTKDIPRRWITGRIKFGTESNGGFHNIAISNCVFDNSRGIALESVDGGALEDVVISNITMKGVADVPLFIRLGLRMRNPSSEPKSTIKRISINNLIAYDVDPSRGIMLMGSKNYPIEDISLTNLKIYYRKAVSVPYDPTNSRGIIHEYVGTISDSEKEVPELDMTFPEDIKSYPDPIQWGPMPSFALYARHIKGLRLSNIQLYYQDEREGRAAIFLDDVNNAIFNNVESQVPKGSPYMIIKNSNDIILKDCKGVKDKGIKSTKEIKLYKKRI